MVRRSLALTILIVMAAACGAEEGRTSDSQAIDRDTLTRRQKDSIIAEMPLPGSGVVGRALDVQDATNARAALHDSLAGGGR